MFHQLAINADQSNEISKLSPVIVITVCSIFQLYYRGWDWRAGLWLGEVHVSVLPLCFPCCFAHNHQGSKTIDFPTAQCYIVKWHQWGTAELSGTGKKCFEEKLMRNDFGFTFLYSFLSPSCLCWNKLWKPVLSINQNIEPFELFNYFKIIFNWSVKLRTCSFL